jgi:hypothetical protein
LSKEKYQKSRTAQLVQIDRLKQSQIDMVAAVQPDIRQLESLVEKIRTQGLTALPNDYGYKGVEDVEDDIATRRRVTERFVQTQQTAIEFILAEIAEEDEWHATHDCDDTCHHIF